MQVNLGPEMSRAIELELRRRTDEARRGDPQPRPRSRRAIRALTLGGRLLPTGSRRLSTAWPWDR